MKKLIFFLLISFVANESLGQESLKKGDKNYDGYAYIDAIEIYEKVANNGNVSKELFQKLGNSYYFNGIFDKAEYYYTKLFELGDDLDPEYYFRYAQSLMSMKKNNKADDMMNKFYKLTNDYRGELYVKNKLYLSQFSENAEKFNIESLILNSKLSDYGSSFRGNIMYFTTTRDSEKLKNNQDKWTNQNYSNLYFGRFDNRGNLIYSEELTKDINSKFHESTLIFSKDSSTVFFTRNNFINGNLKTNDDNIVTLKIYKAKFSNGKFSAINELPFNSNNYNCAHPALSSDGKFLYFSSDMPGGFGSSDLYKVEILENGEYGKPINLGAKINTKSRETFPFINSKNELYFSTDGHPGFGGLDIFKSTMDLNGEYSEFSNLSIPVNSEKDDFAFVESPFDKVSFFSSNRDGGIGYDDIYKCTEKELPKNVIIEDSITDEYSNETITDVKLSLFDANHNFIKEVSVDSTGKFQLELRPDRDYYIKAEKDGFQTKEIRVSGKDGLKEKLSLNPDIIAVKQGDNLARVFGIKIFFSLDKYDIRSDAKTEIAKIIEVMKKYPSMKVEIRSHTDSRQSESYNLRLSEYRAQSTMKYMIKNGISKDRLTAKGYGESELINRCKEGVTCSDKEHEENRRSEFIILN